MADAVDDQVATAAEADQHLHLGGMRVLAHVPTGGDGLIAERHSLEAGVRRRQDGVGVAVGGRRLPERRAFARLHDHRAAADHVRTILMLR